MKPGDRIILTIKDSIYKGMKGSILSVIDKGYFLVRIDGHLFNAELCKTELRLLTKLELLLEGR